MSGHNKWSQIKHQKGAKDVKKGAVFSKYLKAISVAAKTDPKPENNPRLRSLIESARAVNVPNENIERAISKAGEEKDLKDFIFEAYGPEGVAILVEAITDNGNRTNQELRLLVSEYGGKVADAGSVLWAFDRTGGGYRAKFPQAVSEETHAKLSELVSALKDHEDVQNVVTTTN